MFNGKRSLLITGTVVVLAISGLSSGSGRVIRAEAANVLGILDKYGALPLSFIANAGQTDSSVRFQVRGSEGILSFQTDEVLLNLPVLTPDPSPKGEGNNPAHDSLSARGQGPGTVGNVAIRLTFDHANPNVSIDGANQLPGIANFFIGSDPSQWHTGVPTYAGVIYHDLYPGVDLSYGGHTGLLKGTYTIAAGVDPAVIRWNYKGADRLSLDPTIGDLFITAPGGVALTEKAPIAWQVRGGMAQPFRVGYHINSDESIQFVPATYDRSLPLVIDPGLAYSTYLGGSGADIGQGIALDANGNAYVTGLTASSNFPTTPGVFQPLPNGGNVFVTKFNAAGNSQVYSTYLGGSGGQDQGFGIAIDASGNAYVTGATDSTNFPTTSGAFQKTYGGGTNTAFVTELNATGSALLYSTYLGGSGIDQGNGIAVDGSGKVYVIGQTNSTNFPTTSSAFQTANGGTENAFISKLNPTLTGTASLVYSTYLGGGNAYGYAIAVDVGGNAYGTGYASGGFPTTAGVFQPTHTFGYNAFVSKLNPTLTGTASLVYSTYLGGSESLIGDSGYGIAVDTSGDAYVTGATSNANFPTTSGAFQTTLNASSGADNAFMSKLNSAASALIYSTFLGGNSNEIGFGIAVDTSGDAYVTGATTSANFPTTTGAFQTTYGGDTDAFVSKLNPALSGTASLVYSTYLGGSGQDIAYGIALDSGGNGYVTGKTSGTFPTTLGAFQIAYGGNSSDAFVTKLTFAPLVARIDSIGIFRPSARTFYMRLHNSTGFADITVGFGPGSQPYPVVGDWAGVGYDTVGDFDQSNGLFSLCNANNTVSCANNSNVTTLVLGIANDQPLAGWWAANATHSGVGVFRPSNGLIYLKDVLNTGFADHTMVLGIPGDVGLAGDWNGKGFDSPGVYRPSNSSFYLSNKVCNCSVFADIQLTYGVSGDAPVTGDWIAQGHDGIGLFRQSNGYTYLRNTLTTGFADNAFFYGIAGDIPVAGHWQLTYPPKPSLGSVLVPPTLAPGSGQPSTSTPMNNSGLGD